MTERHYPRNADIKIAAQPDSERYKLQHPDKDGVSSVPAMNAEIAKKLSADEHPSTEWEEWQVIKDD